MRSPHRFSVFGRSRARLPPPPAGRALVPDLQDLLLGGVPGPLPAGRGIIAGGPRPPFLLRSPQAAAKADQLPVRRRNVRDARRGEATRVRLQNVCVVHTHTHTHTDSNSCLWCYKNTFMEDEIVFCVPENACVKFMSSKLMKARPCFFFSFLYKTHWTVFVVFRKQIHSHMFTDD